MLFGVRKLDGSTRPILHLSSETKIYYFTNDLMDAIVCTIEYTETVCAFGINAGL